MGRVQPYFGSLVKKERRRQHARSSVGVVEKNLAQYIHKTIYTGIYLALDGLEETLTFLADKLYVRFGYLYGCNLTAHAGQVFHAIVEKVFLLDDFGGWQGDGLALLVTNHDARKLFTNDKTLYQHLFFGMQAAQIGLVACLAQLLVQQFGQNIRMIDDALLRVMGKMQHQRKAQPLAQVGELLQVLQPLVFA